MHIPIKQNSRNCCQVFRTIILVIALSSSGCYTERNLKAKNQVTIKGVVVCEETQKPVNNVYVVLSMFTQESLFRMGRYKEVEVVYITENGQFEFKPYKRRSYQIEVRREPNGLPIGIDIFEKSADYGNVSIIIPFNCSG